jgi:glucans biosynthesis protein C
MDWIRVLATMAVFLYHCSMFFNPFPWHVKNNSLDSNSIFIFSLFVGAWIMPIFFAVSGISMTYGLNSRKGIDFIKERLLRLGVPLVFGVFILTPPQIYIERLYNKQFEGSFLEFYPHFFEGVYLDFGGAGNFAFFGLHLWYLLVLLVFSFITLPLFQSIRGKRKFNNLHFVLLPLVLMATGFIKTQGLGGWDLVFYLVILVYGFYFLSSPDFKNTLKSTIKIHITFAVFTSVTYIIWFMEAYPQAGSMEEVLFFAIRVINCWSLLLTIFYFADKYLSFTNHFLKYASEASMPFYVLHQPVIVTIGYFIKDLTWGTPVKFTFLIFVSFTIIMVCYHYVIRRVNVLRILFGIKNRGMNKVTVTKGLKSSIK